MADKLSGCRCCGGGCQIQTIPLWPDFYFPLEVRCYVRTKTQTITTVGDDPPETDEGEWIETVDDKMVAGRWHWDYPEVETTIEAETEDDEDVTVITKVDVWEERRLAILTDVSDQFMFEDHAGESPVKSSHIRVLMEEYTIDQSVFPAPVDGNAIRASLYGAWYDQEFPEDSDAFDDMVADAPNEHIANAKVDVEDWLPDGMKETALFLIDDATENKGATITDWKWSVLSKNTFNVADSGLDLERDWRTTFDRTALGVWETKKNLGRFRFSAVVSQVAEDILEPSGEFTIELFEDTASRTVVETVTQHGTVEEIDMPEGVSNSTAINYTNYRTSRTYSGSFGDYTGFESESLRFNSTPPIPIVVSAVQMGFRIGEESREQLALGYRDEGGVQVIYDTPFRHEDALVNPVKLRVTAISDKHTPPSVELRQFSDKDPVARKDCVGATCSFVEPYTHLPWTLLSSNLPGITLEDISVRSYTRCTASLASEQGKVETDEFFYEQKSDVVNVENTYFSDAKAYENPGFNTVTGTSGGSTTVTGCNGFTATAGQSYMGDGGLYGPLTVSTNGVGEISPHGHVLSLTCDGSGVPYLGAGQIWRGFVHTTYIPAAALFYVNEEYPCGGAIPEDFRVDTALAKQTAALNSDSHARMSPTIKLVSTGTGRTVDETLPSITSQSSGQSYNISTTRVVLNSVIQSSHFYDYLELLKLEEFQTTFRPLLNLVFGKELTFRGQLVVPEIDHEFTDDEIVEIRDQINDVPYYYRIGSTTFELTQDSNDIFEGNPPLLPEQYEVTVTASVSLATFSSFYGDPSEDDWYDVDIVQSDYELLSNVETFSSAPTLPESVLDPRSCYEGVINDYVAKPHEQLTYGAVCNPGTNLDGTAGTVVDSPSGAIVTSNRTQKLKSSIVITPVFFTIAQSWFCEGGCIEEDFAMAAFTYDGPDFTNTELPIVDTRTWGSAQGFIVYFDMTTVIIPFEIIYSKIVDAFRSDDLPSISFGKDDILLINKPDTISGQDELRIPSEFQVIKSSGVDTYRASTGQFDCDGNRIDYDGSSHTWENFVKLQAKYSSQPVDALTFTIGPEPTADP